MNTFTAGRFTATVGDPWPCWIEIKAEATGMGPEGTIRLQHRELVELKFVLDRAIADARRLVGKDEVE